MISMLKYSKLYFIIIILFNIFYNVGGQYDDKYHYYDSLTYSLYKNQNWKELTKSSRKALKEDLDYYYLRMRAGIALYERGKYFLAENQFKKALKLNRIDPVSREYIYYSKLFSGKEKEASLYYKQNKSFLENKVTTENKALRNLFVNLAYHHNFERELHTLFDPAVFSGSTGYQTVTGSFYTGSFLMEHDLGRHFILSHGGTFLRKNNYYLDVSPERILDSYNYPVTQGQYYTGLSFFPGADLHIKSSIHYIHYKTPGIVFRDRGFGSVYTLESMRDHSMSGRISAGKYFSLFEINAGISLSGLNNYKQFQKDVEVIFYPLGNKDLYTLSSFYHSRERIGAEADNNQVFKQGLGMKLFNRLWTQINIWNGEIKNLVCYDGFVIYNAKETITSQYDLSLIIPGDKVRLSLTGSYQEYYSNFISSEGFETGINKLNFQGLTLITEIKWNF